VVWTGLVQILCFWTLSIFLSLSKNRPVYFSKHNVSETLFCLRLQVKPTQLGPIDRASPYHRTGRWIMSRNIIFILMYHRHKLLDLMDWICLAQDRDLWRALVNTVMNFRVP
jgi:hypothetical protein